MALRKKHTINYFGGFSGSEDVEDIIEKYSKIIDTAEEDEYYFWEFLSTPANFARLKKALKKFNRDIEYDAYE